MKCISSPGFTKEELVSLWVIAGAQIAEGDRSLGLEQAMADWTRHMPDAQKTKTIRSLLDGLFCRRVEFPWMNDRRVKYIHAAPLRTTPRVHMAYTS